MSDGIIASIVGGLIGLIAGIVTGLLSAGKNLAVVERLREDVKANERKHEELSRAHYQTREQHGMTLGSQGTEIALLKQTVQRTEVSLTRIEATLDNLPALLARVMDKPGH